ncbi:MAG: universal stress protein [Acaryochloris sp. RU_4_1]|nr:universal stress protein [Acaryochloris sp. RU_4_1]NJR56022.1 universal stress protein [Acaryochloris sp. CRU_2_0]
MNPTEIVIHVLEAILIVIGLSRLVGYGFDRLKQPLVIGEIVAGIMLGPSLLGWLAPSWQMGLFPPEILPALNVLSQIGLIFFMFLIGLELNPKYLRGNLDIAILISHVSILVPFSLGNLLALLLYPLVSNGDVTFTAFALFLGASMSITAFPVLARIITENNLQSSRLGTLALTCAAVDDVTAWCVLAMAIAVTRTNSMVGAIPTFGWSLLYIAFMVTVGQRFLKMLAKYYDRTKQLPQLLVAVIYAGVVTSALITEVIGIHFIFGAFLFGAVMPKNAGLTRELAEKTEDFVLVFLLPVFFAYSGLKTQIGLLNTPDKWILCGAVIGVAIIGKYVGTYVAARQSGINNREASALGWLMNTRGLTELIVLNIGLELKVISPLLFTMLVIMALVTTFMTSPLLEWVYPKRLIRLDVVEPEVEPDRQPVYRILVPVANPKSQKGLLKLALAISGTQTPASVTPLSLVELQEDYGFASTPVEANRLIAQQQARLQELIQTITPPDFQQRIHPIIEASADVARKTAEIAELEQMNLIIVGWHRPALDKNRLGGRVGKILSIARTDVAVFVDKGIQQLDNLLVPYATNIHDDLALEVALRLLVNLEQAKLTVLHVNSNSQPTATFSREIRDLVAQLPQTVRDRIIPATCVDSNSAVSVIVDHSSRADLTIAGTSRAWGLERQTLGRYTDALANQCQSSLLIMRKYSQVSSLHLKTVLSQDQPTSP